MLKWVMDVSIASLALIMLCIPMLIAALAVRLKTGAPVLFRQLRPGLQGRPFELLKFRTMTDTRDDRGHPLPDEQRLTATGRWLRRLSLDELPQLINVLRGDMSLVGPRPPIPEEVAQYQRWQRRRLSMKPGLTCLWQISGRNDLDFDRWMQLDLEYIDSWSPMLDVKILLKTIPAVLSGRGAS